MRTPVLILSFVLAAVAQDAPVSLRVEYLSNPAGIDTPKPRFYWVPVHSEPGQKQTAYQILVSKDPSVASGDVWDGGKTNSPAFVHVGYGGKALESGAVYFWKVRFWDAAGRPSPYSAPARFGVGLLHRSDWKGKWIAGGNQLRTEFDLVSAVKSARVYISGLGYYELRINGHRVGNHVLDPAWTPYDKRVFYETYDVGPMLKQGRNAVGIVLGEGWYKNRHALMQLNVELANGQKFEVVTDTTWKSAQGPIVSDSVYHGESYDARRETPGWDQPGFNDSAWTAAAVADGPNGELSAQMMPPIRVTAEIFPLKLTQPKPGVFVYDMGQNFAGWVRLRVKGPTGTTVKIRHGELVFDDGTLNVENLRSAKATDTYTLRGGAEEIYEPRFTYHGFRYVELTGFPGVPKLDTLVGRVVHSDLKPIGGFSASKEILNRIQRIVYWGLISNLHSIPTDCDQRDERMGWMADAHLTSEAAMYNFDMAAFYSMWLRSMRDSQDADGSVPDTTPRGAFANGPADPAWGSAYPLILWYMWEQYGDRGLVEQHFEGIRAWADFLTSKSEGGILNFVKFGDWVATEKTPGNLVSTAYWYWSADIVAKTAAILGRPAEAEKYRKLCEEIKTAFHRKFWNNEMGYYGTGTQTAQVLPLYLGMAPPEEAGRARGWLRDKIVYTDNTHLTTGIHGTKYLFPYLSRNVGADLAYDLAVQTTYPSYGYMLDNGATTLWELWQNKTGPSMNSHNHPTLGSISGWFYTELAGISMLENGNGYAGVRIRPMVTRDLQYATGQFETVRGMVMSSWQRTPRGLKLDVTIPFGSDAEIILPKLGLSAVEITEGGKSVHPSAENAGAAIFKVGGGSYSYELQSR